MDSPFQIGRIVYKDGFVNREQYIKHLSSNLQSGINTMLISPRRWGKSSLVRRVADLLCSTNQNIVFCFIDMYNVRTEKQFYQEFAKVLIQSTSTKWQEWLENAKNLLKNIVPRFSFGSNPDTDFSIHLDWKDIETSANEILELPEIISKKKKTRVVICLDEFQNIAYFNESLAFQKKLRSVWQLHQHATYCIYGSKRHIITKMFESQSMPFYKFGETLFLDKIESKYWIPFIKGNFEKTGKQISNKLAQTIVSLVDNHPYFVQLLSNNVWLQTDTKCTEKSIDKAVENLLYQNTIIYQKEIDSLTNPQLNFLRALIEGVQQFSSKENLSKYDLGTSGNILRIKQALESKEVIDLWGSKIEFLDPIFRMWFERMYLKRLYNS
jgi:hypothetical protein